MSQTVLITGASSGIGLATAKYFQQQGWQVVATMPNLEKATELDRLANVHRILLDVTQPATIDSAIQTAIDRCGQIDLLINNAGFITWGFVEDATDEQIYRQFEINFFGSIRVAQRMPRYFREKGSGQILVVTSGGARLGFPLMSFYNASK